MIKKYIEAEMNDRGDNIFKLSKAIGVSHPTLYNYFNDKGGLSLKVLEKIFDHYGFVIIKKISV
jgi:lambda repressor-like predicted transcriptional regulator